MKGCRHLKIIPLLTAFLIIFPLLATAGEYRVSRVIDGDTVILENGERVRLIGVDTTEKTHPLKLVEYFSNESTQFTKQLLEGKEVRLEYDKEKRGKYGRLLAYIYLMDGTFVNAEIIKQGYGFAYTKYPFKFIDNFVSLEKEAENNKRGYWKYGGKGEFRWIISKGQEPFEIYCMSQNLWGIKYQNFIKTRLNDKELIAALNNIRLWANEFHEEDLIKQLLESGWEKVAIK
ncbi:MAG: thermonuclease family protein [Desulfobacteraceae bacterium]|uniref:Thermonuclease family protein n=1 Tax=Candidatus Desulfaltia bathyphila TaxID=2841697 RepID=A0A8J6T6T3_9BACT|nr:thermonuclease family protein [Candidatus Desulfaltia bathyphila]